MISRFLLTLSVLALATSVATSAIVIKPVSVSTTITGDASSSHLYLLDDNAGFAPDNLQRPVGTAVTLPTGTDLSDALNTSHYRAGNGQNESWTRGTGLGNPVFTFDLTGGGDTDINSVLLWQYGNNGGGGAGNEGNSTRDFSLIFHTEAEGSAFDFGIEAVEFSGTMDSIAGDNTADNVAQNFSFIGFENARYAALRIDNNYLGQPGIAGGGDRYGLGEVRFAVPEPSFTVLLGALGSLVFLRRRR